MRLQRLVASATLVFLCVAGPAATLAASTTSPRSSPSRGDGPTARTITSESDLLTGSGADGRVGDVLLENGVARFIIGALDHEPQNAASGGHLLDAATEESSVDVLDHVFAILGDWPRQAIYNSLHILSSGSDAIVVVSGSDSDHVGCEVTTRYRLAAGVPSLEIETVIRNTTGVPIEVAGGDAIGWGDAEHFVPGYGFDVTGLTTLYDEWVAAEGEASYGYCPPVGSMSSVHGSDWTDSTVLETTLAAGDSAVFQRLVAVGRHLSDACDAVHAARGTAVGLLEGLVLSRDGETPVGGAQLDCLVNGLAPYTRIVTGADGVVRATLPPATYEVDVSAPGYYDETCWLSIAAGETTSIDQELRPIGWNIDKGDTLTVVMRPILAVPAITTPGGSFTIEAMADAATTGWSAAIRRGSIERDLTLDAPVYDVARELWVMQAGVPTGTPVGMNDLLVTAEGGIADTVANAVSIRQSIDSDFYIVHITDTHLPTHNFSSDGEQALGDSSEMTDLRAVIDDINTINPAFVLLTGDLVNEGELEDYLGARVFTRAQRLLKSLEVPVFIVAGNHDIGGWNSTPPSDGTARRDWWRFFGWRYLADPPPGNPVRTQDYSFDYGGVHFVGLETYDNYDHWRQSIYGDNSMTDDQVQWLLDDLELAGAATPTVLFYHYDFGDQIDLSALGAEAALWGHIHWSSGSITNPPYNISTGTVCDGRRLYRLVRFSDGAVIPSSTVSAGAQGLLLRTTYDGPNDGTSSTLTAEVTNETSERFEHSVVRFRVPSAEIPYVVDNGSLVQTVVDGQTAVCLVSVNIPAHASLSVTIFPDTTSSVEPQITTLHQSQPNPARTGATLGFVLASSGQAEISVYDVAGRRVATPHSGNTAAGPNEVFWDLCDSRGTKVASGIYFYRLETETFATTRKLVVVR